MKGILRMSRLLEHAREELKLAGYDIDSPDKEEFETDEDYANACAKNVYKMLEVFSEADHSGFSAQCTLHLFNRLAEFKCLTPLTNNPDEWMKLDPHDTSWQSKRQASCFSDDELKTYYDINAEENREWELDEKGKRTGWSSLKPVEQRVKHPLIDYKKGK